MSSFIKGLGLDLFDFQNKLVSVIEEGYGDANFSLGCFMWEAFQNPQTGVCLLALHHSLKHYYHMGMRLGYNLSKNHGINFLAIDAVDIQEAHAKTGSVKTFNPKLVFKLLQEKVSLLRKQCQNVYILIDAISDLLNLGVSVNETILFIKYLLVIFKDSSTLVICCHCNNEDTDQEVIKNNLLYSGDLRLIVRNLETGFSKEVTGSIELTQCDESQLEGWSVPRLYHYKTKERSVDVFLPGNITFSY